MQRFQPVSRAAMLSRTRAILNRAAAATLGLLVLAASLTGCSSSNSDSTGDADAGGEEATPVFSLAWSEYPSWSVFGVADMQGIIDGEEGGMSELERKHNVDIVLKFADYDTCLLYYGSSETDAVCITNMDTLSPSLRRDSVAVMPTSTSVGADACIVVGIDSLEQLKGKPTHGLEMSVSQYCFERNLELQGKTIDDYPFKNMDPGAASTAMQTGQDNIESIMVWNPFVMQTLRTRDDAKVLFDSSTIPEEIIDMVVIGKDSLQKPGGERFAAALIEGFYAVSDRIEDPATADETLVQLGKKFSNLGADDMRKVVEQTQFYKTPDAAMELFTKPKFQEETMPMVVEFSKTHGIVDEKPTIGFNDEAAQVNFTTTYLEAAKAE